MGQFRLCRSGHVTLLEQQHQPMRQAHTHGELHHLSDFGLVSTGRFKALDVGRRSDIKGFRGLSLRQRSVGFRSEEVIGVLALREGRLDVLGT